MSKITTKTFPTMLGNAVKAHGAVRDSVQELCIFSMKQAGNENYTYINDIMNADFKGADQRAMQKYFEDHCDVTLGRKEGKFAFTNNKSKGFEYKAPAKVWWEYKPSAAPQVIDPIASLLKVVTNIENAMKGKGGASIAKGQEKLAKDLVAYVRKQPAVLKAALAA